MCAFTFTGIIVYFFAKAYYPYYIVILDININVCPNFFYHF